jgi:hypothetical protein
MRTSILIGAASLLLSACQQSGDTGAAGEKADTAASLPADANVCDRYFAFVEDYAAKQDKAVADGLLKRLEYDKLSLPQRDKKEADEYCTQSLARMERMTK